MKKNYRLLYLLPLVLIVVGLSQAMHQNAAVDFVTLQKEENEKSESLTLKEKKPKVSLTLKEPVATVVDEEESSSSPMPYALQWWEKSAVLTSVAVVLSRGKNMRKLHTFLGERIASMKGCPDSFEEAVCIQMMGSVIERVNTFLRWMMEDAKVKSDWWNGDGRSCNVAVIMAFGGLRKLYAFSGKQAAKPNVVEIDSFFKTMVKDYGGPFIDRDFNRKSKL